MKNEITININNDSEKDLKINIIINNQKNIHYKVQEIQPEKILEDYTWEEIDEVAKRKEQDKLFKIGDTKSFKLGNEILIAQIADFCHDDLPDGSGKAGISFILKNSMNEMRYMNQYNSYEGGWPASYMYNYLNSDIYNRLPSDLCSVIKPVNKITSIGNNSNELQVSYNKLWLMSTSEVFGIDGIAPICEGTQYPIFTDDYSRIKYNDGMASSYWLRSPVDGYTEFVCAVSINGGCSKGYVSLPLDVVFGFCI